MSSKFRSLEGDEKVLYGLTLDDDPTSCIILLNLPNWVAIRKTRNIYIRRRRVPLSKVCSSISENFHLAYTGGTGQSYVEVNASVQCSRGRRDYSPSRPHNLKVWFVSERNGRSAATPDARFGHNIHGPTQRAESLQIHIRLDSCIHVVSLRTVAHLPISSDNKVVSVS